MMWSQGQSATSSDGTSEEDIIYLVKLKTLLTDAIQRTFDDEYPIAEFQGLHASIEFPIEKQNYPSVWVDFAPVGNLERAGVAHIEYEADPGSTLGRSFTRWKFKGYASYTVAALTSLERDRLYDEIVRIMAFGNEASGTSDFREYIETGNEFLAVNFDFDEIATSGFANTLGTPWQTDDIIYEVTVTMECFGEFTADSNTFDLVSMSEVGYIPYGDFEEDPTDDEGWV